VTKLAGDEIDVLYIIGGDGSMRAARAIGMFADWLYKDEQLDRRVSVVAIPKTTDNDILWVWQSFGFLSAVEKARECVRHLHTEARSNPRLCIIQLFGSDSGFVVSHTALASGACDAALIPEVEFDMKALSDYILEKLKGRYVPGEGGRSPYGLIVLAETAIPQDVKDYLGDPEIGLHEEEKEAVLKFLKEGRRVHGQTPDEFRNAGLKIVSRALQRNIRNQEDAPSFWSQFRVFTNEPRHLIRSIDPSVQDVIFGQRLASLAVDNAMAGYRDFMISQWLTEYVLVPLNLVVLGRKRVPQNGIFWKSVLARTGQPADLAQKPSI
jgi:6-phosphofructokinase 1